MENFTIRFDNRIIQIKLEQGYNINEVLIYITDKEIKEEFEEKIILINNENHWGFKDTNNNKFKGTRAIELLFSIGTALNLKINN